MNTIQNHYVVPELSARRRRANATVPALMQRSKPRIQRTMRQANLADASINDTVLFLGQDRALLRTAQRAAKQTGSRLKLVQTAEHVRAFPAYLAIIEAECLTDDAWRGLCNTLHRRGPEDIKILLVGQRLHASKVPSRLRVRTSGEMDSVGLRQLMLNLRARPTDIARFAPLYAELLATFPRGEEFLAKDFVHHLALSHLDLYTEALFTMRDSPNAQRSIFRWLARQLHDFPHLVQPVGVEGRPDRGLEGELSQRWMKLPFPYGWK